MENLIGKRVELIYMDDPYTRLRPGDQGTIIFVDSINQLHVEWDSGRTLALVPGHDSYKIIS